MLDTAGEPHLMDFGLAKRDSSEMTMCPRTVPVFCQLPYHLTARRLRREVKIMRLNFGVSRPMTKWKQCVSDGRRLGVEIEETISSSF